MGSTIVLVKCRCAVALWRPTIVQIVSLAEEQLISTLEVIERPF